MVLGGPPSTREGGGGGEGDRAPAGPAAADEPAPARARVELTPTEPLEAPVRVEASVDGELVASYRGALPVVLDLPAGAPVRILAEAPGRARFTLEQRFEGDTSVRVPLPPGGRVAGLVVDDRGDPVAGARVSVEREGAPLPPWVVGTDAAGLFEIDTLHAGAHALTVDAAGYGPVARSGVEPGGDRLRVELARVGSVAGRVVAEDGTPRADATILLAGSGIWPARQARSDADGSFRFAAVPPGTYEARAHSGTLVAEPRRGIEVEPGTRAFLTLTLRSGAVLTGIVTDYDTGRPLAGVEITVAAEALDVAPRAVTSDAQGRFRVAGVQRATHRVSLWADGYVPVTALEHDPGAPLEVALTPGGALSGIVIDSDRYPVAGARLEVLGEASDRQPVDLTGARGFRGAVFASQIDVGSTMRLEVTEGSVPPIPIAPSVERPLGLPVAASEGRVAAAHVADQDGRFRITGIPPGHVQVVAHAPGFAPATTARVYVAPAADREGLELVLAPAGRLTGQVVDEREAGVEGVLVEVHSDREPHPRVAFTGQNGDFAIDAVVGELSVTARPPGRPAARGRASVAPGGEGTLRLVLEGAAHRLHGRTVDERGFPVPGAQVAVSALRASAPHRTTVFSAADGTFVADGLPRGPWRLEAARTGYAPAVRDVFDASGEASIPLARGASLSGSVVDDFTGAAVAATVTAVRDDLPPERLEASAGRDGAFEIPRARAARWTLTFAADGYVSATRAVEVVDRGRGPDDVALDPVRLVPGGRVEGTVVDALGHTVGRAVVEAAGRRAATDPRGAFVLAGLPAGATELVASHPAAGRSEPERVRVLAGRETPGIVLRLPERLDASRAGELEGRRRGVALELGWSDDAARVRAAFGHAALAGLRAGDVLVSVDGVAPSELAEARRLLRGAPNVGAVLRVRRGTREAILHVPREIWLPQE
ncbi:MAG: carboxypeptidase regulatory-like domain-containing protein [Sandaracinaceae bacterium]|nr:carboxypeptidase regulatory-like domain-containing protein [Sandaracinaceae bacterium]